MNRLVRAAALFAACLQLLAPVVGSAAVIAFRDSANAAARSLDTSWYDGAGHWRTCAATSCTASNGDWGADALTSTLFLHWQTTGDPRDLTMLRDLAKTSNAYARLCSAPSCAAWSDTAAWDAVADMREFEATSDAQALRRAKSAFAYATRSSAFIGGACGDLPYQVPQPNAVAVKTLETEANLIRAAAMIFRDTGDSTYLEDARQRYENARRYFLDSDAAPLYTVHVLDNGTTCAPVPKHFFASVNGTMIENGLLLWRATGESRYYRDAFGTAVAVDMDLSDSRHVFVDLGGENDVIEPLVEAMYDLAHSEAIDFAREWIESNASAALSARNADGAFSRFFDGPPPTQPSVWESNGGLALQIAAAALRPNGSANVENWSDATTIGHVTALPSVVEVDGSGVALVGTLPRACEKTHVHVFIDGEETFDHSGLWQNGSMHEGRFVVFAWRWPTRGHHTIELRQTTTGQPLTNIALDVEQLP